MDPIVPPHALDEEAYGGIVINPHSALGKELCRWEQHRTEYVGRGMNPGNPYVFRPYPRMLYKAQRLPGGQYACLMPAPDLYTFDHADQYARACLLKESFDRSCQTIVTDESAERIKVGQGWAFTPTAALELAERAEQAIGNAAAEVAFAAQRMTSNARAELTASDGATHEHVVDVVPVKKRGKSAKGTKAVAGSGVIES